MSNDRTTELINLMSAMAREVGLFRQETNARFDKLETRLDRNEAEVRALRGEMTSLRDVVDAARGEVSATRGELSATRGEMNARLERVETNIQDIKRGFRIFRRERDNDLRGMDDLEQRIEALEGEPAGSPGD